MTIAELKTWFTAWKDIITILVAIGAIIVVVFQIRQAGRFERNRLRREQAAARATLSLTLNTLSEYGTDMIRALAPLEAWLEKGQEGKPPEFKGPRLLPETVAAVEKVIAAYPTENVARSLAALIGEVQILQARSRDFTSAPDSIRTWSVAMKDNIVMAAGIVARCQDLFVFAREGTDQADPSRQHLQQVLTFAKIYQHQYPRVWKSTERFENPEPTEETKRVLKMIPGLFGRNK